MKSRRSGENTAARCETLSSTYKSLLSHYYCLYLAATATSSLTSHTSTGS
jgi:hypothetical protein